jgi:phage-related protein (TIGR01555 family)
MGVVRYIGDRLLNLVANLGTSRDKASASYYGPVALSDLDLWNAYVGSWLPRKIVDIPALDSCRKWRNWQASAEQISAIEAEEKRLGVQAKILEARIKGRLYGGAAVFIGINGDRDTASPLRPELVAKDGIGYLTVIPRTKLQADTLDNDPISPNYGKPSGYKISSAAGEAMIHPSRLVLFGGNPFPDVEYAPGQLYGWSDSVLTAAYEACKNADSTIANIASLVFEAKVDVFHIPSLMQWLSNDADTNKLIERFRLANIAKGINGAVLLDAEEKYEQKTINFAALTDILREFLNIVAGASDIPVTRLLGQSPGGLNATGQSDLRNYYDRVQAAQTLEMSPAMFTLDECLIRSALGSRPKELHYAWASLWQVSETEQAEIGSKNADTIKKLGETGLFDPEALAKAAVNMLVENAIMPGLEEAVAEFPFDAEEAREAAIAAAGGTGPTDPDNPDAGISA